MKYILFFIFLAFQKNAFSYPSIEDTYVEPSDTDEYMEVSSNDMAGGFWMLALSVGAWYFLWRSFLDGIEANKKVKYNSEYARLVRENKEHDVISLFGGAIPYCIFGIVAVAPLIHISVDYLKYGAPITGALLWYFRRNIT